MGCKYFIGIVNKPHGDTGMLYAINLTVRGRFSIKKYKVHKFNASNFTSLQKLWYFS